MEFVQLHEVHINEFINMNAYYSMIKDLPEDKRQIVTLKVLGGFTHKEIAEMLSKPIGTVQWQYNTSIKKLKVILSSLFGGIMLSIVGFTISLLNFIRFEDNKPDVPCDPDNLPNGNLGGNTPIVDNAINLQSLIWIIICVCFTFYFPLLISNYI